METIVGRRGLGAYLRNEDSSSLEMIIIVVAVAVTLIVVGVVLAIMFSKSDKSDDLFESDDERPGRSDSQVKASDSVDIEANETPA